MRRILVLLTAMLSGLAPLDASEPAELGPFDVVIAEINEIKVPAQELGLIRELHVKLGDVVEEEQVIGRVDDSTVRLQRDQIATELEIAVHRWESDLAIQLAEKALGVADSELARAQQANAGLANTVSQTEVDRLKFARDRASLEIEQARLNRRQAELTVEQKRQELKLAELAIQRREIRAPAPGLVVEVLHVAGEWAQPGEAVVRILNTNRVHAEAMVDAHSIDAGLVGRPVKVVVERDARPRLQLHGTVTFIDPRINVVSGECRLSAEIDNPDQQLRPGQRAVMTILGADTAAVPSRGASNR